jgi:pyruvate dehydrogenase (quinone)
MREKRPPVASTIFGQRREQEIRAVFAQEGPVLIDAVANRQELPMPPKIQLDQAKGFILYML